MGILPPIMLGPLIDRRVSRIARLALGLAVVLALGPPARAQRFEDLGPSLGLPVGSPGITTTKALIAGISAAAMVGRT